jgi:subtilisin family serine protease
VHAQSTTAQLSALTKLYIHETAKAENLKVPVKGFVYKQIAGKWYLSALIKVNEDVNEADVLATGSIIGTKAGKIWTVQIPLGGIADLAKVAGVTHIDVDAPIAPAMDAARKTTRADSAQKGFNLPVPMTGKGVVVGIIDAGFDYDHPTLYDSLHGEYRVRRIWAQKGSGTPPSGYAYGNEYTDSNAMRAAGCDTSITSHGTHVAGIAAGSGHGSNTANNRFRGMAYESEMVFVGIMPAPSQWVTGGVTDVIDGMNYIYTYANSVGKPCIANLSWGSSMGPHDGHSLFSQACDALTGAGKIFTCSAGNSGEDTIHLQKTFTTADNSVSTFVTFSPYLDTNNQKTWVDIWGDTSKSFCLNLKLYNGVSGTDSTLSICLSDTVQDYILIGADGDTCFATISMVTNEYNGKPHAFVSLHSYTSDNICLTATGTDGTIDMWEGYIAPPTGYYGALKKLGYSFAVSGDTKMTVSDISSSFSAISVGAYTSKSSFTNINGSSLSYPGAVNGRIAPFSSLGPVADGRIKPDITGPGFSLASAVSSYDPEYFTTGDNYIAVISKTTIGSRTYPYAMSAGTSMSAPAVAGIVALMLQVNPNLNPDSVKSIINANAIKDSYTGVLPPAGNNTWGHGKINAYKTLRYLAQQANVENTLTQDPLDCIIYPNPSKGKCTISYISATNEPVQVAVYDVTGKLILHNAWNVKRGGNLMNVNMENYAKGMYFVKISCGNKWCTLIHIIE